MLLYMRHWCARLRIYIFLGDFSSYSDKDERALDSEEMKLGQSNFDYEQEITNKNINTR